MATVGQLREWIKDLPDHTVITAECCDCVNLLESPPEYEESTTTLIGTGRKGERFVETFYPYSTTGWKFGVDYDDPEGVMAYGKFEESARRLVERPDEVQFPYN